MDKPKLLLHSCCGPCSTAVIERLKEDYNITIFFYNPNIMGVEEYEKRKETQLDFLDAYNTQVAGNQKIGFLEGSYDLAFFLDMVKDFTQEPEGGNRCKLCIYHRLQETARVANSQNYDLFATTLTVSPHKNYEFISASLKKLGMEYKVNSLDENFKKKDGYKRSTELSRAYNLYRQSYCGCKFIMEDTINGKGTNDTKGI